MKSPTVYTSRELKRPRRRTHHFAIRQVLNGIFMLLAVIGVGIYFFGDRTTGTIVILIGMVFKMAECVLRMIRTS